MNYHNILHDDMRNGEGLRVTLFVSGCNHCCNKCQNPQTWDVNSGINFDEEAENEIFEQLNKYYIDGITLSGGDPLHNNNLDDVFSLIFKIRDKFPNKTIWLYSGFTWEDIFLKEDKKRKQIVELCDVFVDGVFIEDLADVNYHWAGSTNQKIIDVKKSLEQNKIVLYCE